MSNSLFINIRDDQLPIVYDEKYNVSFGGFEKFHVFDVKKWRNIICYLKESNFLTDEELVKPLEAKKSHLLLVHTEKYLKSLKWSAVVAIVTEVPFVACVPNFFVQRAILKPLRLQTGGSVLAGKLAIERGWAINVGGGFHHCYSSKGGGFCPYADITLMIRCLMSENFIRSAMIVDLDAHQGNGHERDFIDVPEVYILDMYNRNIYPRDRYAKRAIRKKVELRHRVDDLEYLLKLRRALKEALEEFSPDLIVYNAGTDILDSDPLGMMYISEHGVIKRDEIVFTHCKERKIPIVMLTSGGYLRKTARIIASSIMNLEEKGLIDVKNGVKNKHLINLAQLKSCSEPTLTQKKEALALVGKNIEDKFKLKKPEIAKAKATVETHTTASATQNDITTSCNVPNPIPVTQKGIDQNCSETRIRGNTEPIPVYTVTQNSRQGNTETEMLPVK